MLKIVALLVLAIVSVSMAVLCFICYYMMATIFWTIVSIMLFIGVYVEAVKKGMI